MNSVHNVQQCTVHRLFFIFILLSTFYFLLSTSNVEAAAPVVSLKELLEQPEDYDAKTIIYQGEVIGDIMIRGEHAWINVRDETGAIGVFCPKELVEGIEHQGSYRFSGDIISVKGIFHRFCPQHGGDADIHAENISIIKTGEKTLHPLPPQKLKAGTILAALAFALAILHLVVRKFR